MSKITPPLPPYDQACIRAWAIDYAIRTNRNQPATPFDIIEDAKEFEAYLVGKEQRTQLEVIVEFRNGKRPTK